MVWNCHIPLVVSNGRYRYVLDIATGTGDIAIAIAIAKTNPQAWVIGLDFSLEMLNQAKRRVATEMPLAWQIDGRLSADLIASAKADRNLKLMHGDAMDLPFANASFDVVSISFGLRNMTEYANVLAQIFRVLRPGGTFFCLDASYPTAPVVKSQSWSEQTLRSDKT